MVDEATIGADIDASVDELINEEMIIELKAAPSQVHTIKNEQQQELTINEEVSITQNRSQINDLLQQTMLV